MASPQRWAGGQNAVGVRAPDLAHKLAELERKIESHDTSIRTLFEAIHHLTTPPEKSRREIGFHVKEAKTPYRVKRK